MALKIILPAPNLFAAIKRAFAAVHFLVFHVCAPAAICRRGDMDGKSRLFVPGRRKLNKSAKSKLSKITAQLTGQVVHPPCLQGTFLTAMHLAFRFLKRIC